MDKVLIIGCSAAGKSTVAREVGQILHIEVVHLDKVLWKPNCQLTPKHEEPAKVEEILGKTRWVIDGNYTASLPMRLKEADTIIFIDFPRSTCLLRAMKRLMMYKGRTRPDMGAGCPETFNFEFLKWIWRYPKDERPNLLTHVADHGPHAQLITLKSQKEVDNFLSELRKKASPSASISHHVPVVAPTRI